MLPRRGPARQRNRSRRTGPTFDESLTDPAQPRNPHHEHFRPGSLRQLLKIKRGIFLRGIFMSRENRQLRAVITMRHRNPRVGWSGNRRGNPRHNLELHPRICELGSFFTTAPKNHGVTALEARDNLSLQRLLNNNIINLILRNCMSRRALARKNQLTALLRPRNQLGTRKCVINQNVAFLDAGLRLQRDQPNISRARAHQVTNSFFDHDNS